MATADGGLTPTDPTTAEHPFKRGDLVSPRDGCLPNLDHTKGYEVVDAWLSPSSGLPYVTFTLNTHQRSFLACMFKLYATPASAFGAPLPVALAGLAAAVADSRAILKDTNPKTAFGVAKPPMALLPGVAVAEAAEALRLGSRKYGSANWRSDPVTASTYANALLRHLHAWLDGEDLDRQSGANHLGHVMANAAILLDAKAQGTLIDDRPPAGKTADYIDEHTRPLDATEPR